MTECRTPQIQDLLPDYAAASLDAAQRSVVEAHLLTCEPCGADLLLLRRVRALPVTVVEVDVARIVAGLSRPASRPVLRLEPTAGREPLARATAAVNVSRRRWSPSVWKVAAAVGVMVVGGASVLVTRHAPGGAVNGRSSQAQSAAETGSGLVRPLTRSGGEVASAESVALGRTRGTSPGRVSVSYGDLGDYSEAELQGMLDRLERWDGASSTEPLPSLPVVSIPGGL
jgi:anti-sigma factor RsiW